MRSVPLKVRFEISMNGEHHRTQEIVLKLKGENLGDEPLEWTQEIPAPKVTAEGATAKWVGSPLKVPFRVSTEAVRESLVQGTALEATVQLPVKVEMHEGKRFVRDAGGQTEGVIDTTWAELTWARR